MRKHCFLIKQIPKSTSEKILPKVWEVVEIQRLVVKQLKNQQRKSNTCLKDLIWFLSPVVKVEVRVQEQHLSLLQLPRKLAHLLLQLLPNRSFLKELVVWYKLKKVSINSR